MRRVICSTLIIGLILGMLSACSSLPRTEILSLEESKDQSVANDISTQIANYLEQESIDNLLDMFSKNAIRDQKNIKDELQSIVKALKGGKIEGDIISKGKEREIIHNLQVDSPSVVEHSEYGSITEKEYGFYFIVNNNGIGYRISIEYVQIDEKEPDEVGIKTLYVYDDNDESEETFPEYGIYYKESDFS